jgi:hypothetical protein
MSLRAKKARRWKRRLARAARQQTFELGMLAAHIRHGAEVNWGLGPETDARAQQVINGLIVHTPEYLVFREKRKT